MNIGIFTKLNMCGGSEFRAIEMARGINEYTDHSCFLLSEKDLKDSLKNRVHPSTVVVENCFEEQNKCMFSWLDVVLVINTDSKSFTTLEFWKEKGIDVATIKTMVFLFNFIVSPAQYLSDFIDKGVDVRIITGNKRFFDELGTKDKHQNVSILPRMILESPIDKDSIYSHKTKSTKIRIGKHSKPLNNKWNDDHFELISRINKKYKDKVEWDFMGGSTEFEDSVKNISNVLVRKQFTTEVKEYLLNLDIFLFFPSWSRQECWARSCGEALMSGCPLIATDIDGGNRMQVIPGSNGFLCKDIDDFEDKLSMLIETPKKIEKMSQNAKLYARTFETEEIVKRFIKFVEPI